MKNVLFPIVFSVVACIIAAPTAFARPITGSAVIHLTTPVTKEISEKAFAIASGFFKTDCVEWMKEETGITIDTTNAVWNHHLSTFTGTCLKRARQESSFFGREWTLTITLAPEQAEAALKEHNTRCHSLSVSSWTQLKKMLDSGGGNVFQVGIQTIFFSMGRMEKVLDVPGSEEPGSFLIDDARAIVQNIANKITIRPSNSIISGKSGNLMVGPLDLEVLYDTIRVPNFNLIGTIAPGRKLLSGKTGSDGIFTLKEFRIPFVAKGSLFYVAPDFGAMVDNVCSFSARDLGITFHEQTLLFNTAPATFTLNYRASAASDLTIPGNFKEDAFMRKYLNDSCFLKQAPTPDNADLSFTIATQVSSYSNDSTETTTLKAENAVTIKDASKKILAEKAATVLERSYETNTEYPRGLFFWEAARKSCHMVKNIIDGM